MTTAPSRPKRATPPARPVTKSARQKPVPVAGGYDHVHSAIVVLLDAARRAAVRNVNVLMSASYWGVGRRIVEYEQSGAERASYGEALLKRLSVDLTARFGRGFSERNLEQMRLFYLGWPISQTPSAKSIASEAGSLIPQTLSANTGGQMGAAELVASDALAVSPPDVMALGRRFPLPWSAYVRLLSVKSPAARTFYETEALRCGWTVRQLGRQVDSQFYERIALSKNKVDMLAQGEQAQPGDAITPEEAIRDPFMLEFLNLKDEYSESDLEDALIQHLADFLLELGDDFAFVGRQRRLRLDDAWFRIDLLFFHRRLKCLVVIDLKVGRFSHADVGQMQLYLNYARAHWMKPGENPPVGLILCASKGAAEAHYALDGLQNKVLAAEYQTVLPNERLLAEELRRSRRALEHRRPAKRANVDSE
jgi:predicted nuclease of restriction endonuclease-like (RecB) superfamily